MTRILITGANKGIGFALAQTLGNQGNSILVGARNADRGQEAVAKLTAQGISAAYLNVDLSNNNTLFTAAETVKSIYPDLGMLINNAGIPGNMQVKAPDTQISDLQSTMQVNFFGNFTLIQALLPVLETNRGRIINITIPTAANPFWNPLAYKTSKAALNTMTTSLAAAFDADKRPLEIFSIHPGPTTTDLNGNAHADGFQTPDQVAQKIAAVLNDGKVHQGEFIETGK
ncbi:short-chain dehydrogenase [Secundilactobacillus paracollinoides]|uniref:SDR family NAD(P)-dependent oxidoreductase n=1 Tax=Secundilactobacillus paracollinoides TaxID=240427 RepID=UPI0006F17D58|nr:SDR family NAD(P)-dependent oxidoreductase [Secundilactobacillus paracollinoides]ANZ64464.1 short-chain dehydrogenase [Secundilactobacillus paracollinoides]KRL76060.1 oxidoreductase, short chain dehydrogenase reductase family protein [Secundilactobacillus paracollinoides DSM 15502 = JCM 11969]